MTDTDASTAPVAVGLIGAGAIGAFHGETLARRLPGARLVEGRDLCGVVNGRLSDQVMEWPLPTTSRDHRSCLCCG